MDDGRLYSARCMSVVAVAVVFKNDTNDGDNDEDDGSYNIP